MVFWLVNALSHSGPFSFPYHDFFTHQNGRLAREAAGILIKTIPVSMREAISMHCSRLSPYTHPHRPNSELLAMEIASSRSLTRMMEATGPKTSSW